MLVYFGLQGTGYLQILCVTSDQIELLNRQSCSNQTVSTEAEAEVTIDLVTCVRSVLHSERGSYGMAVA